MAQRFLGVLLLILVGVGYASAQQAKEPLRNAKVGDYVVYKLAARCRGPCGRR